MNDRIIRAALTAAALAAATLNVAAPASARAQVAAPAAAVSAPVSHADLNLATKAGVSRLEARVRRAAERLCGEAGVRPLYARARISACTEQAIATARPQMRSAVRYAAQGSAAGAQ